MCVIHLTIDEAKRLLEGKFIYAEHLRKLFVASKIIPTCNDLQYMMSVELFEKTFVKIVVECEGSTEEEYCMEIHIVDSHRYTKNSMQESTLHIITAAGLRRIKENLLLDSGYGEY